jgi:predicted ATPase
MSSSIATAHILGLVSFRPEFRHEFGNRSYYKQIHLSPLGVDEAREMIQNRLGHDPVPPELEQFIVMKSEGNPLFIEEVLQALFDQGVLVRGDTTTLARPLNAITIPATVQGILASRIDGLPAAEKALLHAMAVMGRSSPISLLKRVVSWPDNRLEHMLANLQFLEFVYEQPTALGTEYVLKHALTQDVAYNSLLREQRAALHERVAHAVETLYADWLDDHLDELAHHYGRSGDTGKAVQYLHLAGRQALARSALADGVSHLTHALALLETQEAGGEQAQQELQVRLLLGPALMASEGYVSPKVEQVYSRARELCGIVGDTSQLCAVLYGLFGIYNTRATYSTAIELALEMIRLADSLKDPIFLALASFAAGQTQFLLGELGRYRRQFEQTARFYSRERQRELTLLAGFDCGIAAMAWDSLAMWMLGYPNGALSKVEDAAGLARELGHPHSLIYTLSFRAWLCHFRREWRAALEQAQTVRALADEHGLPLWSLWATTLGGAAMVEEGQTLEGREQLTRGLEAMRAASAGITMTQTLGLVAQAHAHCAEPQQGLMVIGEALVAAETNGERYYLAELNRLHGELHLTSNPSNNAQAQRSFRTSIDLARRQDARSLELRATTSLARLLKRQGQTEEACRMLAEIYHWFTDGFDTADLKEAKALLDELNR